ncbi:MAG: hypothetical protein ACKORY_09730 [Actinomycetota bacterium]
MVEVVVVDTGATVVAEPFGTAVMTGVDTTGIWAWPTATVDAGATDEVGALTTMSSAGAIVVVVVVDVVVVVGRTMSAMRAVAALRATTEEEEFVAVTSNFRYASMSPSVSVYVREVAPVMFE